MTRNRGPPPPSDIRVVYRDLRGVPLQAEPPGESRPGGGAAGGDRQAALERAPVVLREESDDRAKGKCT